jgi:hypothetical protein
VTSPTVLSSLPPTRRSSTRSFARPKALHHHRHLVIAGLEDLLHGHVLEGLDHGNRKKGAGLRGGWVLKNRHELDGDWLRVGNKCQCGQSCAGPSRVIE